MPADQPIEHQPPRDVGRFGGTAALDEPCQGAAVALEIVTHAIQPFGLRRSDQPLRGEDGFARAIARQSLQGVVALARGGELSAAYARTVSSIWYSGRVATEVSARSRRLLSIRPAAAPSASSLSGRGPVTTGKDRRGRLDRKRARQRAEATERALLVGSRS